MPPEEATLGPPCLAVVLALLVACLTRPPANQQPSAVEPVAAPAESPEPSAPAGPRLPYDVTEPDDCPQDTTVAVNLRTIDSRKAPSMEDWKRYEKMRFAPEHLRSPDSKFALDADVAVEKVIALELANPELIPTGFRDELIANPRDSKLRLRMARCELFSLETRRRASYDALMAHLLGVPLADIEEILIGSTKYGENDDRSLRSCPKKGCGDDSICDAARNHCMTPRAQLTAFISDVESKIEDALSRAVMPALTSQAAKRIDRNASLFWWGSERVHRCGRKRAQLCKFTEYSSKSGSAFVHWDLRDGGTVKVIRCEDMKDKAKRKSCLRRRKLVNRCWDRTRSRTEENCLWRAKHFRWSVSDVAQCFKSCAKRSELRSL